MSASTRSSFSDMKSSYSASVSFLSGLYFDLSQLESSGPGSADFHRFSLLAKPWPAAPAMAKTIAPGMIFRGPPGGWELVMRRGERGRERGGSGGIGGRRREGETRRGQGSVQHTQQPAHRPC